MKYQFKRGGKGIVILHLMDDHYETSSGCPVDVELEFTRDEWCSIIATMSYYDECDYGFYRAQEFHAKMKPDPITTPIRDKEVPEDW